MKNTSTKYFLTFQTVFIKNENIKWLEEFLIYYIYLGFEQFYLYDNTGSIGYDGSSFKKNKYNFIIQDNSENDITFNKILEKYKNYITYIKWQPKNINDQIIYGQDLSIMHYKKYYGNDTTFCAFMDLDEFLYSENNINLIEYLKIKLMDNIYCIRLCQKKFKDRHLIDNSYITQCYECVNIPYDKNWGVKNIILVDKIVGTPDLAHGAIHNIYIENNSILLEDPNILRFNHYNTNYKQLNYIKNRYNINDISLNEIDNGMQKYYNIFI